MSDLWGQLLASTVVAALVSAGAILGRELLVVRAGRRQARLQSRRARARHRVSKHEMLLREIDSLWRHNARLRRRETACQRRCRTLERRLSTVEGICAQHRRRLEGLARLIVQEPANLHPGNARDRQSE